MIRFIHIFIAACLLLSACQKGQDVGRKKETQEKAAVPAERPQKITNEKLTKEEIEKLDKEANKEMAKTKEMLERGWAKADKEARLREQKLEVTSGPITEEEQKFVEEISDLLLVTPEALRTEEAAKKYIKILLKGDHKSIRWSSTGGTEKNQRFYYDEGMAAAISKLSPRDKEALELVLEAVGTRQEYPKILIEAARILKFSDDERVIPLLREVAHHAESTVRLDVARSLLSLGDADTALPILDELAENVGFAGALNSLFAEQGKIIDERGFVIVEKALKNPRAGVRITAVKLLLDTKRMTKEKAEEIALGIVEGFYKRKENYYGIGRKKIKGETYSETFVLPGFEGKTLSELERSLHSDGRACDYAMSILGDLKSKKAIPLLRYIKENNTEVGDVCWENLADKTAEHALKNILENGGGK